MTLEEELRSRELHNLKVSDEAESRRAEAQRYLDQAWAEVPLLLREFVQLARKRKVPLVPAQREQLRRDGAPSSVRPSGWLLVNPNNAKSYPEALRILIDERAQLWEPNDTFVSRSHFGRPSSSVNIWTKASPSLSYMKDPGLTWSWRDRMIQVSRTLAMTGPDFDRWGAANAGCIGVIYWEGEGDAVLSMREALLLTLEVGGCTKEK